MSASASKKKRKEVNEQGLTQNDIAQQKEKEKKLKSVRNVCIFAGVAVICVVGIILLSIFLQGRKYIPDYDVKKPAATISDEKISVPVYNHFYNLNASEFYETYYYFIQTGTRFSEQSFGDYTLEDLLVQNTNSSLQGIYNLYIKAKNEGFELTKEDKDQIQSSLNSLETEAATYGFKKVDQYLAERYGVGCTKESYEEFLTVYTTYYNYLNKLQEEYAPSQSVIDAKYAEDKSAFDVVVFTYTTTAAESSKADPKDENSATVYTDEAKEAAKTKAESLKDNMPDSAIKVAYQKSTVVSNLTQEIADWLFDDSRKEGDAEVFARNEEKTNYFTVRFEARDDNDYNLADALMVSVTKDTSEVKEGEKTALEKFNELYDGVKESMTADEFNKYVTDLGFTANQNSYARTSTIEGLAEFLYDSSRKEGDFIKLENDTSYLLVRFVKMEDDTYRNQLIKQTLWNTYINELTTFYPIVVDEEQIKFANTDLIINSQSS